MRLRSSCAFLLLYFYAAAVWAAEPSILEEGAHCVAYRVKKTVFFIKSDDVIGRNCDVSAQVLPEVGGHYHVEVNIPIRGFSSGDSERDRDVMKILKADQRPELTFKSASRSADEWREMFAKKEFVMDGELAIGDKSYPLKVNSRYVEKEDGAEIDGSVKMKFQDFGLRPPKVGGGLIANVKPDLELHYRFSSQRILGGNSIRVSTTAQEALDAVDKIENGEMEMKGK